jgi:hypothetical protein
MKDLVRRLRIPKLYLELGIIVLGAVAAGLAIWFFEIWPHLVNWLWFFAGAIFGVIVLCLIVAFFAFGARGESPSPDELHEPKPNEQQRPKPRLVKNGSSSPK